MKPKREGPFTITVVLGPVTIKTPSNLRIYNIFHATLLQPYKENETYGSNFTEPPPELLKWEEVYEIENILNHWKCERRYHWQYLIKWKGYPISDTSWEPEQSFLNDGNTLEQYKLRHGLKWLYTMQMASRLKIQHGPGTWKDKGSSWWRDGVIYVYKACPCFRRRIPNNNWGWTIPVMVMARLHHAWHLYMSQKLRHWISWVLNGFPPFFWYNRHNVLCSNKLKAQINVYLSRKFPKTWKYGTNCSFSPHQSRHVSWVKVLMGIVAVNIPMAFKTSPKT